MSLHDPGTRPIRKGRLGKPVELGYMATTVDNHDGLVPDHDVEAGKAAGCTIAHSRHRARRPRGEAHARGGHRRRSDGEKAIGEQLSTIGARWSIRLKANRARHGAPSRADRGSIAW